MEDIINAAKAANIHTVIDALPDKYETQVGADQGISNRLFNGERFHFQEQTGGSQRVPLVGTATFLEVQIYWT